jgi:single-stranded-DNA-specific exonuclease
MTDDPAEAKRLVTTLEELNQQRRQIQDRIFLEAKQQAEMSAAEAKVLVLHDKTWDHGINGIVASKIVETYRKPTFILEDMADNTSKGSARSIGDFSLSKAIVSAVKAGLVLKGGGHQMAAGVTIETSKMDDFKKRINQSYFDQKLPDQTAAMLPKYDIELANLAGVDLELVNKIDQLRPFGMGNPRPTLLFRQLGVLDHRPVGANGDHAKLRLADNQGNIIDGIGFGLSARLRALDNNPATIYARPSRNEFNGRVSVQLEIVDIT